MAKSLVIVESPAKARTINRYLGDDFVVKSSVGHIRDLPVSGANGNGSGASDRARAAAEARKLSPEDRERKRTERIGRQLIKRMGIDPANHWKAHYEILPGKEKVISELRKAARDCDFIYLATDLDREGEAIAWHLREAIGGEPERYRRVVFNEITRRAIAEAFEHPGEINLDRVNAQQARRFLDRVVGFMLSPLLWGKIARGLSAGRVQSVAVRLVVEREREIKAFVPEEYWELFADLLRDGDRGSPIRFEVNRVRGKKYKPRSRADVDETMAVLRDASFEVSERKDKPTQTKPGAPFITSTLQQAASSRLGFGVKKTMTLAQKLYEAGYITYMRTDSTNLSADALGECRVFIGDRFGAAYLPDKPKVYASKAGAQEAHEAIRPSDVHVEPGQPRGMDRDAERLYELIWRQFVACQMPPAEYTSTTISAVAGEVEARVSGRILRFDGFTRVQPQAPRGRDEVQLPDYRKGDVLRLLRLEPLQHFTKPPARYNEAALVKELEKRGIGRPSTYATIISTIQERGYVSQRNKRFYAEKIGDIVTDRLVENFTDLLDYGFTAELEEALDRVSNGEVDWLELLDDFYRDFTGKLRVAQGETGMRGNLPTLTDLPCPQCGRPMQIRTARTGVFLGCSGYSLPPKERCRSTINLIPGDEVVPAEGNGEEESRILRAARRCGKCGTTMTSYLIDENRKIHICSNNPDCAEYELEEGRFKVKGYDGPVIECDKCGANMELKSGRFGKYFGCTSESCKNTRRLLRNGEAAPPRMEPVPMPELRCERVDDTYVLRDGAAGIFLAASQFPRNRETRAPFVDELIPHGDQIEEKYRYLLSAPVVDSDGRRTLVRYDRKAAEHYVTSEIEGKKTGWSAHFVNGAWKTQQGASARASTRKKAKPKKRAARKTS